MSSQTQTILYETLATLGGAGAVATLSTSSPVAEPYFVLRNEISASTIRGPSPENAAPDYFSLELDEANESEGKSPVIHIGPTSDKDRLDSTEFKTLEGNWFHANHRIKSPMLRLHKDILEFSRFLSPTPEEQQCRNVSIEAVSTVIKYIWPNSQVEVFGSFKTGLYVPSSDIDIVILGSNVGKPTLGLQALSRALSRSGISKKMQVILKAKVPIIKFVEKNSGFAFDISFDIDNGPKSADFVKQAMSKWPPLRPLCLILKVFLQQRELNEVYTGGIGSYALLSMLIAMLRIQKDHQGSPENNLGVLLVNFFDMYGCKLNTSDVGISCNGDSVFFQKHMKGFSNGGKHIISIEDPQAPENDIGKGSFNYYQVRSAFAMAYNSLTNVNAIMQLGPDRSILGTIIRPDAVLLERKGGLNGRTTFDSVLPGAGEPLQLQDYKQDIHCNWTALHDDYDEPLPRGFGNGTCNNGDRNSSTKKRKSSSEKTSKKKLKQYGETPGSSGKRSSQKKKNWKNKRHLDFLYN